MYCFCPFLGKYPSDSWKDQWRIDKAMITFLEVAYVLQAYVPNVKERVTTVLSGYSVHCIISAD